MSEDEVQSPEEAKTGDLTHEFQEQATELKPEDYNPEDLAAAFFSLNHKRLLQGFNQMSKRQLIRVCYHIACMGLHDTKAALQDEVEKRCAYVMNEMITNRVIMQLHMEMEKAEKASLTEASTNDIIKPALEEIAETKLENNNG